MILAAALLASAVVQAHFPPPPPPPGVYSTAPGAPPPAPGYGYGPGHPNPCACNLPCSCAPTYGPNNGYGNWASNAPPRPWSGPGPAPGTGYRLWSPPTVVAGDAYAVAPQPRPRVIYGPGPGIGPGPVIVRGDGGVQYVNGGSNGGAYVAQPYGGPRIVVGGYDSIRGPVVGGSNGYAQADAYNAGKLNGPRELSYNAPVPFGAGRPGRLNYLGRGGADGYIRPAALDEGPMTTVKIVLPDGTTKSISIPARFLSNTVDEYAAGGANKYAGPVLTSPLVPADPFSPLAGGREKYISEPPVPIKYISEPVAATIPIPAIPLPVLPPVVPVPSAPVPAVEAAAHAAAKAAAEAAVGALPAEGTAAADVAAAALTPVVAKTPYVAQPAEAYKSGKDEPVVGAEDRRLANLYRALLLHEQQDTPAAVPPPKVPEPSAVEIERILEERREQAPLPDARGKFDRPNNLEDYIVLRKDDPRAIYLRDHLLQLEQQAQKDATAAAAVAAGVAPAKTTVATVAPSQDPNFIGENVVVVQESRPFSHDERPKILKGTRTDLLPTPLKKEDVIAELLEQQQAEATERAAERVVAAQQAKIRKQLIAKQLQQRREEQLELRREEELQKRREEQLQQRREEEAAAAATAADEAAERQQQVTQDELPPGWQIGIRVPTEENGMLEQQSDNEPQAQSESSSSQSDPRAHFDRQPIDVRQPRPPFRGTLIEDPRLNDFRPLSNGREVAPSAISRETKSVPEFPEFFDGLR